MPAVYLDHAATTPLDPRVLEAMRPYLTEHFGNASSVHALGRRARFAVEEAREEVADLLNAEPGEVVFTSGGTEADNLALHGLRPPDRPGLLTGQAEHEAILRTADALERRGVPVIRCAPTDGAAVTPAQVAEALTSDVGLVSLMHANNEVGSLTDLVGVADVCRARGVRVHADAVQTAGLFRLDVRALGVDALSLSGHKFYGPKGVGVLYASADVELDPLVRGGAQERGRRGGTENVAAIVGLARALRLAYEEAEGRLAHLRALRERLLLGLDEALDGPYVFTSPRDAERAAAHIVSVAFPPQEGQPVDGEMLLLNLDMEGVLASAGSACTSGALEPSHVLLALGLDRPTASAAVRFSMGKGTTEAEVDRAVEVLAGVLRRMRRVAA